MLIHSRFMHLEKDGLGLDRWECWDLASCLGDLCMHRLICHELCYPCGCPERVSRVGVKISRRYPSGGQTGLGRMSP